MKLADIVSFRKDLLFQGAVQIGWFETDQTMASKAAENFAFHGPEYHGVRRGDPESGVSPVVDTASFTVDILDRITGKIADDPLVMAIAGYGTGKSHLGITIATLLNDPTNDVAKRIMVNLESADKNLGSRLKNQLSLFNQSFLVVTINGMQDFDLSNEIIRQVIIALNRRGLDTSPIENLRPRFKTALIFTQSFFKSLRDDYFKVFGPIELDTVLERLKAQDEETFVRVSKIYEEKMGAPIHTVGQESLHEFIRVTKETYCGSGKPYGGILIIFDEFGRYLEFAVQKPHVAGSGSLQQLFECVQANSDGVYLLCFIQYELKAYISRIAPELRDDLNRYVTRYDSVRKVRLSTNLETLIANLLEKKDPQEVRHRLGARDESAALVQSSIRRWFPDSGNYSVWANFANFEKVVWEGCWPLHPATTWMLYKMSSVGKSLQQRSALSLLAEVYSSLEDYEMEEQADIRPVNLCNESLISEFLASEQYGRQGASAHGYETVLHRYQYEFVPEEIKILKAVLVSSKIGAKVSSKPDCFDVLAMFTGMSIDAVSQAVRSLEAEYGVLEWNELLNQYVIIGEAAPRKAFISYLESKVAQVTLENRANIFSQNYARWSQKESLDIDFDKRNVTTKDWIFRLYYSSVTMIKGQIEYALRTWRDASAVDESKGQFIYCYVGPESNLEAIENMARDIMRSTLENWGCDIGSGAPVAVQFLHDVDGGFGKKVAEYWVLQEQMNDDEAAQYTNFILDRQEAVFQEMSNLFSEIEKSRNLVFATEKNIATSRIKNMLTQLFDEIYCQRIPFSFDGFDKAKGNAAQDSKEFTRTMFLGNFDRDYIAGRVSRQKNRAIAVFDESWGVLDNDGSLRSLPRNNKVRDIVYLLEKRLNSDADVSEAAINVGEMLKMLCAPPYGCNIASAGLLLALFFGRRRKDLNLIKNNHSISIENWISEAMPSNYLSLPICDMTTMVRVSAESVSEWERLLDEWGIETTLLGKVEYLRKAEELQKRIPEPQALHYRVELLQQKARDAQRNLRHFDDELSKAIEFIERGKVKDDAGQISRGAAKLALWSKKMELEYDLWRETQRGIIVKHLASGRTLTQQLFSQWLNSQIVYNVEQLTNFKNLMSNVERNLANLGLTSEVGQLRAHVEEIEQHVRHIAEVKRVISDIENMIRANRVTNSTRVTDIQTWLNQVQDYALKLTEAEHRTDIVKEDIRKTRENLAYFQVACNEQLTKAKERTEAVYNIESFPSLSDIANLRTEVAALISIYDGREKDVQDLKLIQRQLDLLETHYNWMNDKSLNEEDFEATFRKCVRDSEDAFTGDAPPLDNEMIYGSIRKVILHNRILLASNWMESHIPNMDSIKKMKAQLVMEAKSRILNIPAYLSTQQRQQVVEAVAACEQRLNYLEVEGLVAQFEAMTEDNKRTFIVSLVSYIQSLLQNGLLNVSA